MKASDVPEDVILEFLAGCRGSATWFPKCSNSIHDQLPDVPPKVLLAKLKSMVRRGLIQGCACGCRGDFRLPPTTFNASR